MPRGLKRLSYRVQGSTSQAAAAAHWAGFTFMGGPVQVKYEGPWGQMQVWASSEAEGRRVIGHACAHAGISPEDPAGEWFSAVAAGDRWNGPKPYRVKMQYGLPVVTTRPGPDGPPLIGL